MKTLDFLVCEGPFENPNTIMRLRSFVFTWGMSSVIKRLCGEPHVRSSSTNKRGAEPSGIGSVLDSGINVIKTFPACCCLDSLCFWVAPLLPLLFLQYMVFVSRSQPLCERKNSNVFKGLENKFFC